MSDDSSTDLERAVFLNRLDPDNVEDYVDIHSEVPEFVPDAMESAGVERFQVFVKDDIAVCILDVHDLDDYRDVYVQNPEIEDWERRVNEYKREGIDVDADGEQVPFMDEIWSFTPDDGQSFSRPE
jgi:L-rhamnose mutarotase